MNLNSFLREHEIKQGEFASLLGITKGHISQIANAKSRPSPELAARIEQVTGGAVSLRELLFPNEGAPPPEAEPPCPTEKTQSPGENQ